MRSTLLALLLSSALSAQGSTNRELLVDFGASTLTTTTAPRTWNNLHSSNQTQSLPLLDTHGFPTGIQLSFNPARTFVGNNQSGTQTPTAGSPMAALGFPSSVTRDTLWGSNSRPIAEFELSNLDPNSRFDFAFCASRTNVGDQRSTLYTVQGSAVHTATLEPANNTSAIAETLSVLSDATGRIHILVQASPQNTNSSGYFYLNGLRIRETTGGPIQPRLGFLGSPFNLSRIQGSGATQQNFSIATNDGKVVPVSLSAIDTATGIAPTWLSLPTGVSSGAPQQFIVSGTTLAIGHHAADLTATAQGYLTANTRIDLLVRAPGGPLNLLFYGNSYSMGNGGVPNMVDMLAEEAGYPQPKITPKLSGGKNLNYHLTDPGQAAAITQALPTGEYWDAVTLQGFSLEATTKFGNPAAFISNALQIFANVRAHSPKCKLVVYQTWARGTGHSAYPGTYPNPMAMHHEIEANYQHVVDQANTIYGAGTAFRAAAGNCVLLHNWDPAIYSNDLSHPKPEISTMAAMTIFSAIYKHRACDIKPAFGTSSRLAQRLASNGFDTEDYKRLAGIADREALPSLRHFPGSGEDFLFTTGINGVENACALRRIALGDTLDLKFTSPAQSYVNSPLLVTIDIFNTGSAPGPIAGFPDLFFDPARVGILFTSPSLTTQGAVLTVPVPLSLPGKNLIVQGIALQLSPRTGASYTVSDARQLSW